MTRATARDRSPLPAAPTAGATAGSGEREEGRGPPERGAAGRGAPDATERETRDRAPQARISRRQGNFFYVAR